MKKLRERVKEVQDLLFGQITQGLAYFYCAQSLYRGFRESQLMKNSYLFFGVYEATKREAILALARIMKEHPDSITIHYLFNLLENNPRLLSSDNSESVRRVVAGHRAQLEKYEPLIESVCEQRDRVLAHLDRKHVNNPSDLFAYPQGVNLTELGECLWKVLDVLNFYAGYYGNEFDPSNLEGAIAEDVDILLKWMREYGKPDEWTRSPVFS
jgi:hypothetical protein